MSYVCIDTHGACTTVAAVGKERVLLADEGFVKASRALMPMLDEAMTKAGITAGELDFLSVVIGPGSFTGIRIGVSAVRALAYALNKKVVAINSCELAAYNSRSNAEKSGKNKIMTLLDAGNGFAFTAVYDLHGGALSPITCLEPSEVDDFISRSGDCFIAADKLFSERKGFKEATGEGIIELSKEKFDSGLITEYGGLEPLYVRRSQAEAAL